MREDLAARSLHFSSAAIQSRMDLRRPDALTLEYTRTMMAWTMLRPAARTLAMIGLGGGSIAKFCHRHMPQATLVVVEIDPRVIALREAFRVPADDARLRVVEDDGARFVAATAERFDVLMVDAFDADGLPPPLGTQRFYDDCLDVLTSDGLLVVNLHAGDAQLGTYVERIARSVGGAVLRVDDRDGTNSVVFAARGGGVRWRSGGGALRRPANLSEAGWKELRGAFSRVTNALAAQGASDDRVSDEPA
ncbi:MAG: fused MFS/spermidine synthase [Pseudomonadota bacterium]